MKLSVFTDGGSRGNPGPAACAFVVKDETNKISFWKGVYLGVATNNSAEYQGVIEALKYLSTANFPLSTVNFYLDSELVVKQLNGIYKVKDQNILQRVFEIRKLISNLNVNFSHIPREQNHEADKIVNETLDSIQ